MLQRWWPTKARFLGIAIVLVVLLSFGYDSHWTGFGRSKANGEVEPAKTLWDWLNLLIVPAVLAGGGLLFNHYQDIRQRKDNKQQQRRGLKIENQHAQDAALQAYLGQMGELLLREEDPLRESPENDARRILARAWTLTVLETFNGGRLGRRKRRVLRFLYESKLINDCNTVVDLSGANLSGADLTDARVTEEQLCEAESLKGATMPDGQTLKSDDNPDSPTFKEWLESRDRKEDGENGNLS